MINNHVSMHNNVSKNLSTSYDRWGLFNMFMHISFSSNKMDSYWRWMQMIINDVLSLLNSHIDNSIQFNAP